MTHSGYRILKLKSGEEIITKIIGQKSNNKMVLDRPMVFKSIMIQDEFGMKKEITVLKNWLSHSKESITTIPADHVASFLEPDNIVVDLYNLEKEKEDGGEAFGPKKITGRPSPTDIRGNFPLPFPFSQMNKNTDDLGDPGQEDESPEMSNEDMMNFLDAVNDALGEVKDDLEDMINNNEDSNQIDQPEEKDFVIMNMLFPPSIIEELIDRGIINPDDLLKTLGMLGRNNPNKKIPREEISDKDTSNELERKDYGNKWSDWSSDLTDYI